MKKLKNRGRFLEELKRGVASLKHIKSGEVHILSVHGNYGHYQIVIGPEKKEKRAGGQAGPEKYRPIEINGEIHHLFMTPHTLTANPSKRQMLSNLKDTVIMRGLSVHLQDPKGDGRHLARDAEKDDRVVVHECINMAGKTGEELVEESKRSEHFPMAAYRIIQNDILRALHEKSEDALEDVTEE